MAQKWFCQLKVATEHDQGIWRFRKSVTQGCVFVYPHKPTSQSDVLQIICVQLVVHKNILWNASRHTNPTHGSLEEDETETAREDYSGRVAGPVAAQVVARWGKKKNWNGEQGDSFEL